MFRNNLISILIKISSLFACMVRLQIPRKIKQKDQLFKIQVSKSLEIKHSIGKTSMYDFQFNLIQFNKIYINIVEIIVIIESILKKLTVNNKNNLKKHKCIYVHQLQNNQVLSSCNTIRNFPIFVLIFVTDHQHCCRRSHRY